MTLHRPTAKYETRRAFGGQLAVHLTPGELVGFEEILEDLRSLGHDLDIHNLLGRVLETAIDRYRDGSLPLVELLRERRTTW